MNNLSNAFSGRKLKHLFTLNTFKTHYALQFTRHQRFNFGILKHFSDTSTPKTRCNFSTTNYGSYLVAFCLVMDRQFLLFNKSCTWSFESWIPYSWYPFDNIKWHSFQWFNITYMSQGLCTPMMLIGPFIIGIYTWKSGHTYPQLIAVTMINI